ncbi:MAG: cupredoxin domain-containing protein [Acidimicrobiia bacterium]|nr:cupredoxin domain-containing protein [Acidimicrobiia bacterium]
MAVTTLLLAGCGGGDDQATSPPVSLPGTTNDHGTAAAKDDLELEADDFYFGPTFVSAGSGQSFTIQLKNEGSARHTFTSPSLGLDLELAPGATRTVSATAPATGSAEFHCRFHQGEGMQGAVYVK